MIFCATPPGPVSRPYHATLRSLTSLEFTRTFITEPREFGFHFDSRASRGERKEENTRLLQGINNKVHACKCASLASDAAQVRPCDGCLMCYVLIYRNAPFAESSQIPRTLAPCGVEESMIPGRGRTMFYEIITVNAVVQSSRLSRAIE